MSSTMRGTMKSTMEVAWVAPPIHKGLEKSNTFLSASEMFLREPITKLPFPLGALLAGLTQ